MITQPSSPLVMMLVPYCPPDGLNTFHRPTQKSN